MSVLDQRGYRNFWIAGAFSDIGLNIWFLGAVWLVLNLTDSVAWVGLVGGITAAPVLLTLVGGALGDRWNRRNIVVGSRAAWFAMGLVIALLVMTDAIEPWHILLGALSVALADSIGSPANGALIVDLVGKPRLLAATSMGELANYTGEIIAPLLVGVLIASVGIDSTFYAAAIALGIGVYFILRVPITSVVVDPSHEQQNLLADIRDGFRYARRTPGIAPLFLLAARMLFGAALFPMIPIYARDILEVGSTGFAVMMAALGAGFIVGSLIGALGSVGRRGFVIFGLIAVWDVGMVIFSQADWYVLTVALIFVMGVAGALTDNLITVSIQQLTEDRVRGRVSGLHRFVNYLDPAGVMLGGLVASLVSIEFALIAAAIASTVVAISVALTSPAVRRL